MLGAIILWGLFFAIQRDMAVGFLDELWSRNLVNLFSTPLSCVSEYMAGLIAAVNLLKAMIRDDGGGWLIAWACYAFDIFPALPAMLPYMLNLMLFALALGIIITGLIFRYTTKIQGLAWSFAGLLMPLSCVLYPLKSLPTYLRPVAWMLPTTHSFEGMRQVLAGGGFSPRHFGMGPRAERGLLHLRGRVLPMDLRIRTLAGIVSEAGIRRKGGRVKIAGSVVAIGSSALMDRANR